MLRKKRKKPLTLFTKQKLHSKSTYFYKQRWFLYSIPLASTLALLLVMGLCISPLVPHADEAYAANSAPEGTVSLIMMATDSLNQETQTEAGKTAYRYNRFKVGVGTGISQYQIIVQAANGYSSNLIGKDTGQAVNAVSGSKAGKDLSGEWGYSLAEGGVTTDESLAELAYKALPSSGSTIADYSSSLAEDKDFTIAFAANIVDKPSDHYQTNVLLSVAAGADEVSSLHNITYMQDMTSKICSLASENDTTQLIDKRDNKKYWVAKLKDGNCWMTQNLDLDIPASGLTAELSDMEVDWNSSSQYKPVATQNNITQWNNSTSLDIVQSYNPDDYYYTTPNIQDNNSNCSSTEGLAGCTSKGWKLNVTANADISGLVDISDWTPTTNPAFITATSYTGTDGTSTCTKKSGDFFGNGSYSQCRIYYNTGGDYSKAYEHYHAGNYYSWIAATAGAGSSTVTSGNVDQSICPKSWRLPIGGNNDSGFRGLLNGLSNAQITAAPYYLVPGGCVQDRNISSAGFYGYYWPSTANTTDSVNSFFTGAYNGTSNQNSRFKGHSIRCVAK